MARQKARQHHAVEGRKKQYRLKLDDGLHDLLQNMVQNNKPRYKKFIAAWEKLRELKHKNHFAEIETERRNEILLNFVIAAHSLMKKYDGYLQKPERKEKHARYLERMTKVFRVVASESLQTQLGKSEFTSFGEALVPMDAIRNIAERYRLPTHHLP